jgi:hypothetical protein
MFAGRRREKKKTGAKRLMTSDSTTFEISYHGEPETIKNFDYTESKKGLTDAIKAAYESVNGRPGKEISVSFYNVEPEVPGVKAFRVLVSASYEGKLNCSPKKIIEILGFCGKEKTMKEKFAELLHFTVNNKDAPAAGLQVHIQFTESEVDTIIMALDVYSEDLAPEYQAEYIELRRRLHTALTLAKIKEIDEAK